MADGFDCVLQTLFVATTDHDFCTVARKADSSCKTQSRRARGDDCSLSGNTKIHVPTLFRGH
jgi:hypothetical protein